MMLALLKEKLSTSLTPWPPNQSISLFPWPCTPTPSPTVGMFLVPMNVSTEHVVIDSQPVTVTPFPALTECWLFQVLSAVMTNADAVPAMARGDIAATIWKVRFNITVSVDESCAHSSKSCASHI